MDRGTDNSTFLKIIERFLCGCGKWNYSYNSTSNKSFAFGIVC